MFKLKRGSVISTEQDAMEDLASEFFVDLIGNPKAREYTINLDTLNLPALDLSSLKGEFTEEEIWGVIRAMPPDKAPGPDGLSAHFFQACWPVIKLT